MKTKRAPMSPGRRFRIWRRDGFCCTYCGASALTDDIVLEVDHIVPVAEGGTDTLENLTTACRPCNWSKGPHRLRAVEGGKRIVFQFPAWMEARLDAIAQRTYSSRSQVIRRLLAEALEREDAPEAVAS